MADYRLNPDGPHSDDYTREVAEAFAESVRVLNYATRTSDGATYPSTVHDVLGGLRTGIQRMDQLLGQLDRILVRFGSDGLADSTGRSSNDSLGTAHLAIEDALTAASALAARLDEAFNATSGLYLRDGDQ